MKWRERMLSGINVDADVNRAILLAGAAVDALDVAACAWGYLHGDIEAAPAVAFGGGAVSFLMLAAMGWRGGGFGKIVQGAGKKL
jgi:hypothetical protein